MTTEECAAVIVEAGRSPRISLDLRSSGLSEIPPEIGTLANLESLNLADNRIRTLPPQIGALNKLVCLDVSANLLETLPPELGRLANLRELDLFLNLLVRLPPELGALGNLRRLNAYSNKLTDIPPEICNLTNLEELDLFSNRITHLPPQIGMLSRLKNLNLQRNRLEALPPDIGELRALEELDLSDNLIRVLPPELGLAAHLTRCSTSRNPIVFPSPEIVSQGSERLLAFLRAQATAAQRRKVWTSKLLVVGEGGAGKTSLVRSLRGERFSEGMETTHGIEVRTLLLKHPIEPGVTMTLNAWDFGGQEIYHATHQFFLTNRSLFLLLWNARLGYEQGKLDYWLDAIRSRAPDSPVMLVATHVDERDAALPLVDIQRSYPQVQGLWSVSNLTGAGVSGLRDAMAALASNPKLMPLMGETWPKSWFLAAEAIRAMPQNAATPQKIVGLLEHHRVRDDAAITLRRWMHELGEILDFSDDEELKDIIILKPQWVTRHISDVLESEEVIRGNGVFPREVKEKVWREFDPDLQQHFLRLMEKFDLSYRTFMPDEISIIVERLPYDEDKRYVEPWDAIGAKWPGREITMDFRLAGNLPAGVPTWFIARSHRFTTHRHWRYGALFSDGNTPENLALIRAFPTSTMLDFVHNCLLIRQLRTRLRV
jgi:GTPase SAR1 family protein